MCDYVSINLNALVHLCMSVFMNVYVCVCVYILCECVCVFMSV